MLSWPEDVHEGCDFHVSFLKPIQARTTVICPNKLSMAYLWPVCRQAGRQAGEIPSALEIKKCRGLHHNILQKVEQTGIGNETFFSQILRETERKTEQSTLMHRETVSKNGCFVADSVINFYTVLCCFFSSKSTREEYAVQLKLCYFSILHG